MNEIVFVTHNKGKIASAKNQLEGVNFSIFEYDLEEPRSDDIRYISKYKVMEAYKLVKKPCISLDCGFFIDSLNGFPRAFVNFSLDTLGVDGILKLMSKKKNRKCCFRECLSYFDGNNVYQFMGGNEGTLSKKRLGCDSVNKWSDLWYVFKPYGYDVTLAQMTDEERKNRSNVKNVDAMREFAKWYVNRGN